MDNKEEKIIVSNDITCKEIMLMVDGIPRNHYLIKQIIRFKDDQNNSNVLKIPWIKQLGNNLLEHIQNELNNKENN